jgi:hypothetical protein
MTDQDDPGLEHSLLSGEVTRDGLTLKVQIYRLRGSSEGWSLEVVDQDGASTVWQDVFATDQEAFKEFERTLETEGPTAFLQAPPALSPQLICGGCYAHWAAWARILYSSGDGPASCPWVHCERLLRSVPTELEVLGESAFQVTFLVFAVIVPIWLSVRLTISLWRLLAPGV